MCDKGKYDLVSVYIILREASNNKKGDLKPKNRENTRVFQMRSNGWVLIQ